MRGRSPFPPIDFGTGTRVLAYEPEFIIGDAIIGDDGTLYVSFMYALLPFVQWGAGAPEPNKLAILTAGALRPIPTSWLPNSTVYLSFKSQSAAPLVFSAGGDDYFMDYDGVHRLPHRQADTPSAHMQLAAGERCVAPLNRRTSIIDALTANGIRRTAISTQEGKRLNIASQARIDCYHFARRNIFEIQTSAGSDVYLESAKHLTFVAHGTVYAANDHRLLISTDAGNNHAWLLEGFAL